MYVNVIELCSRFFLVTAYNSKYSLFVVTGMSQVPKGDRSDFVVLYEYRISERSTFQPFVNELRSFIDGKHEHIVFFCFFFSQYYNRVRVFFK